MLNVPQNAGYILEQVGSAGSVHGRGKDTPSRFLFNPWNCGDNESRRDPDFGPYADLIGPLTDRDDGSRELAVVFGVLQTSNQRSHQASFFINP